MKIDDVHRGVQTHKPRKRCGRGPGSGLGKTAGRGHKGQRSRAGWSGHPAFQGGTMPLARRVPKRGFHNRFAKTVVVVNVADLEKLFASGDRVTPEVLRQRGLAKGRYDLVKILGNGELTKSLVVSAHRFSRQAAEKIRQSGGEAVVLTGKAAENPPSVEGEG